MSTYSCLYGISDYTEIGCSILPIRSMAGGRGCCNHLSMSEPFFVTQNNIDITYFSHVGCVTPRFSKNIVHSFRERYDGGPRTSSIGPQSACGWRGTDIDKTLVLQVDEYWKRYPLSLDDTRGETVAAARNRKENEENLLILFRKCFVRYRADGQWIDCYTCRKTTGRIAVHQPER